VTDSNLEKEMKAPDRMRLINRHKVLAKYDWREGILYLSHQREVGADINELISKCFDLSVATKRLKANNSRLKMDMHHPSCLAMMSQYIDD
jgi:hypothetical protein